jgi:hypothetical protein
MDAKPASTTGKNTKLIARVREAAFGTDGHANASAARLLSGVNRTWTKGPAMSQIDP